MAVLAGLCMIYRLGSRNKTVFLVLFLTAAVIGFGIALPMYAVYRGTGELTLDFLKNGDVETFYSDPVGPFAATIYILQSHDTQLLTNAVTTSPLWSSFILWIPRAIWPDRPLDMSEAFARFVFEHWQPGYGMGFSPMAEGVLRFGDWGHSSFPD